MTDKKIIRMTYFGWKYCAGILLTLCCSSFIRLTMLGFAVAGSNKHKHIKNNTKMNTTKQAHKSIGAQVYDCSIDTIITNC